MQPFARIITTLRRAAAALVLTLVVAGSALAQAGSGVQNVDANGVILGGHDAVSYQTENKAVMGSAEFTATHNAAIYRFASALHRDAFNANPAKYAPAYGGYCAMGVAVGKKLNGDPTAFTVANGSLFLNVNPSVRSMWARNIPGNNAKAEKNWAAVATRRGFDTM